MFADELDFNPVCVTVLVNPPILNAKNTVIITHQEIFCLFVCTNFDSFLIWKCSKRSFRT